MSRSPSRERYTRTARRAGRSAYDFALDVVLTGVAVIVPLVVTFYVLSVAFDFVSGALNPIVKVLEWAGLIDWVRHLGVVRFLLDTDLIVSEIQFLTDVIAVVILGVGVVAVGLLARVSYGEVLIDYFDRFIAAIPGVGSVYDSFRRMSDTMLSSEAENFQEVKLVEFPHDGTYTLGFKTATSPPAVSRAVGIGDGDGDGNADEEMLTLFLPLAPNPVMGGFLTHVPTERVFDVDMTVEEGVRSIVTSGIAKGNDDRGDLPVTERVEDLLPGSEGTGDD